MSHILTLLERTNMKLCHGEMPFKSQYLKFYTINFIYLLHIIPLISLLKPKNLLYGLSNININIILTFCIQI